MIQELASEAKGNVNHLAGSFPKDWKQTIEVTTSQIAANSSVPFLLGPTLEGLGVLHFWVHGQHTSWSHQDIFAPSLETGLTRQTWSVKNKNNQSCHLPDFPLKTNQFCLRFRTVSNFGDGDCRVGEIRACAKSRGDGALLARASPPSSKLETTRCVIPDHLRKIIFNDTEREFRVSLMWCEILGLIVFSWLREF